MLDHALDFGCRLLGALGKKAYFIGHHGKATALFAGPGCLDGRVQGQQIGLFGNRTNHFQDAADPGALAGQGLDHPDRFINGA
ncbi:hypothetical protein D3C77_341770 [compost metagenome]